MRLSLPKLQNSWGSIGDLLQAAGQTVFFNNNNMMNHV
jgi:hypothetical protein